MHVHTHMCAHIYTHVTYMHMNTHTFCLSGAHVGAERLRF